MKKLGNLRSLPSTRPLSPDCLLSFRPRKRSGALETDDELILSRASDVKTKMAGNREAEKEGPAADCISCSVTSVLRGVRLRVKGEKQSDNVEELMRAQPDPSGEQ